MFVTGQDAPITEKYETHIGALLLLVSILLFFSPWIMGLLELNDDFWANLIIGALGIFLGVCLNGMIYLYKDDTIRMKLLGACAFSIIIFGVHASVVFVTGTLTGIELASTYQQTYTVSCVVAGVTAILSHIGPFADEG